MSVEQLAGNSQLLVENVAYELERLEITIKMMEKPCARSQLNIENERKSELRTEASGTSTGLKRKGERMGKNIPQKDRRQRHTVGINKKSYEKPLKYYIDFVPPKTLTRSEIDD